MWDWLFGCSHKKYSFPITLKPGQKRPEAAIYTGTYVACLTCGREYAYDWHDMKVILRVPKKYKLIPRHDDAA